MASGGGVLGANATRREERSATAQSGEGCVDVLRPPPRPALDGPISSSPGPCLGMKRTSAVEIPGELAPQAIKNKKKSRDRIASAAASPSASYST